MEVYSPASRRLWRPAAQRQVRNAWSAITAQRAAWASSSSAALSAATSLVNCCLQLRYLDAMDLGVLSDMQGIREKARTKLKSQQESYLKMVLAGYENLVQAVCEMARASKSMRTYLKSSDGPIIGFGQEQKVEGDFGDGGGLPVFASLSLLEFEKLAAAVLYMYESELKIKWLLVSEFQAAASGAKVVGTNKELPFYGEENFGQQIKQEIVRVPCSIDDDSHTWRRTVEAFQTKRSGQAEREVLQVYLTAWLAEVHIRKQRIEGIFGVVNEESGISDAGSSPKKPF